MLALWIQLASGGGLLQNLVIHICFVHGTDVWKNKVVMLYRAFERYMTLSSAELKAVTKVITHVKHVIGSTLDGCSCDVIGSYSTGLALAYSDIDFAITLPHVKKEAMTYRKSLNGSKFQKTYRRVLLKLRQAFAEDANFLNFTGELVDARVPIVRVTHQTTGQEIQVQISTGTRQRQRQQHILAYLAEYPTLRPLYFVIRSCLEMRQLNITFEGGLGSYSILMLIVNALKHASGRYDPHDVGSQLLHVLDFYSSCDLYQTGFSIEPPCTFRKGQIPATVEERLSRTTDPVLRGRDLIAKANPRKPYLLCLQDPADPTNDLGSKAYAIKHIQQTFATARKTIVSEMEAWDQGPNATTVKPDNTSLLGALIHGNYRRFENHRQRIENYGSSTSTEFGRFRRTYPATGLHNGRKISAREMLEKIDEVDKRKAASMVHPKKAASRIHPRKAASRIHPKKGSFKDSSKKGSFKDSSQSRSSRGRVKPALSSRYDEASS
ncbi:MAG: hypothetical protein Q9211_003709 [Gyalolechia sp. 1 TL-2023]